MKKRNPKIKICKNGPYLVLGDVPLAKEFIISGADLDPERWEAGIPYSVEEPYSLCRCGHSARKPFCDGSHAVSDFDGSEKAPRKKYGEMAERISGPNLVLTDVFAYCALARFCHKGGDTWNLTEKSDAPAARQLAVEEAGHCPSGRLVAVDKQTGMPIEPQFAPAVSLVEDRKNRVSGPLWVKGGIPIRSADGYEYEVRNRVTLCRCGASQNKPFCDGSHCKILFNDGDESLARKE